MCGLRRDLKNHLSRIDLFLGVFKERVLLLEAGLQKQPDPVSVMVHGEVSKPSSSVGINTDFVALLQAQEDGRASHRVLVVVFVVLVEDGGHFLAVEPDGQQGLLVIVGGDVEDEHVAAAQGTGEHASVGVHASSNIDRAAL